MITATFRKSPLFRFIAFTVLAAFAGMLPAQPKLRAGGHCDAASGQMIHITHHFEPPQMVGLKSILKTRLVSTSSWTRAKPYARADQKEEFNKIIKYFLVSLAMPIRTCGSTCLLMNPTASSLKFSAKRKWAAIF